MTLLEDVQDQFLAKILFVVRKDASPPHELIATAIGLAQ
jgi:hypothetical protein